MRTLSSGLLAAQQDSHAKPQVPVYVGALEVTSRVKYLRHRERPYGSTVYITLNNSDKALTADYRGEEVTISYGCEGEDSSTAPHLWVLSYQHMSRGGKLLVELECIDIWLRLSLQKIIGGGGVKLAGTIEGSFTRGMTITGQTSGATGTVNVVGDGYLAVGKVSEGTDFTPEEVQSDWDATIKITVTSVSDIGAGAEPTWDRDTTILAIIQNLCAGIVTVVLDSSDGIIDSYMPRYTAVAGTPVTDVIQDMMNKTKCAIRAGNDGDLHIFNITNAPGVPHYTYDTDHSFLEGLRSTYEPLPNSIIVIGVDFGAADINNYSGTASYAEGIARFPDEVKEIIVADVASNDEADDLAEARLNRILKESTRGEVEIPIMNCGQELFDYVKIEDSRLGIEYYGWVGYIERVLTAGVYKMTLGLGYLSGAEGLPPDSEYPLPNLPGHVDPIPGSDFPWMLPDYVVDWTELPRAIQGYHTDIAFSATDWDTVAWTSGTIKFYDGTTQAVASGNTGNLGSDAIRHIYFDLDDASPNVLKVTTDYLSVFDEDTGVLCLIQRGSSSDVNAMVIPSYGKEPLITADVIWLTGLLDVINAAGGNEYEAVLSTYIQAGRIKLSETWQETSYRTVSDANKTTWDGKPDDMDEIGQGTSWLKIASTEIYAGHIRLSTCYQTSLYRTVTDNEKTGWGAKIKTFAQDSQPTAENVGDLWIDTNDKNKVYRWSGSSWILLRDEDIQAALDAAAAAQAAADGKIVSFFQTSAPTAEGVGDLWFDTDDGNKCYRWNGASWAEIQDDDIAQAISDAADAQATADGKIVTYYQASAPSCAAGDVGDLWVETDNDMKLYRCSGSSWQAIGKVLADTEISAGHIRLWGSTIFDGEWYHEGDIIIDAGYGIQGKHSAVVQWECKNSDGRILAGAGAVWLDVNGISVAGGNLLSFGSGTPGSFSIFGSIRYTSGSPPAIDFWTVGASTELRFHAGGNATPQLRVLPSAVTVGTRLNIGDGSRPTVSQTGDIGGTDGWYDKMYSNTYYGKNTTIQSFQDHDDIAMLKSIKSTPEGFLDIKSFPSELLESDEDIKASLGVSEVPVDILRGYNTAGWQSLLMGAILQLDERLEKLETV